MPYSTLADCIPKTSYTGSLPAAPPRPQQSSGKFLEVVASLLSLRGHIPHQETIREKIFTPLTVESAVDAR